MKRKLIGQAARFNDIVAIEPLPLGKTLNVLRNSSPIGGEERTNLSVKKISNGRRLPCRPFQHKGSA